MAQQLSTLIQNNVAIDIGAIIGTVPILRGGTGATTAPLALTALGAYASSNPSGYISSITSGNVTTALGFTPENAANKGAASGYAPLDATSKISSTYLPSYVDDVLEYANLAALPVTGTAGLIYVTVDTNKTYRWSGSAYVEISASPGSTDAVTEGTTNKYYTDTRARASISATQNLTYNSSTGVITGPVLSGYAPLASPTFTGTVTAPTFTGSLNGGAAYSNALRQSDGTSFLNPVSNIAIGGSRTADLAPNTYTQGLFSEFKNSSLYSFTGIYTGLLTYAPWYGTTASTGDPSYQLAFSPSAASTTSNPSLKIRAGIDTTWGAWNTIWHSGNLTNLNQLTNGPGYLTAEADTLATVTARGATTTVVPTFSNGAVIQGLTVGKGANAVSTNTAVGVSALNSGSLSAVYETAIGYNALIASTTGNYNTAVGGTALKLNTSGSGNTAVGVDALSSNISGTSNSAVGVNALAANTGSSNSAVGVNALQNNTGSTNIGIGSGAGSALTTGSNNTIIGSVPGTAGLSDTVIIAAGSNERMRITSSGNMGVNTSAPQGKIDSLVNFGTLPNVNFVATSESSAQGLVAGYSFRSTFQNTADNGVRRSADIWSGFNGGAWATEYLAFGVGIGTGGNDGGIRTTERMRIDGSGNVGIGTISPNSRLNVAYSSTSTSGYYNGVRESLQNTSATAGNFGALSFTTAAGNDAAAIWTVFNSHTASAASGDLIFGTANAASVATERMRIDSSGNVGIGAVPGNVKLNISGNSSVTGNFLVLDDTATTARNGVRFRFQSAGIAHWNMGIPADVDAFTINGWAGATQPEYFRIMSNGIAMFTAPNSVVYSSATAGYGAFYSRGSATNVSYHFFGNDTSGELGRITVDNSAAMYFSNTNSAAERMRIDPSGNVGIGTGSPLGLLDVNKFVTHSYTYTSKAYAATTWYRFFTFAASNQGQQATIILRNPGGHDTVEIKLSKHTVGNGELGYIAEIKRLGSYAYTYNMIKIRVCDDGTNAATHLEVQLGTATTSTLNIGIHGYMNTGFTTPDMTTGTVGANTSKEFIISDGVAGTNNQTVWGVGTAARDLLYIKGTGNVGIGTNAPTSMLTVAGQIESTVTGYKFPDGTVQASAATGAPTLVIVTATTQTAVAGNHYVLTNAATSTLTLPASPVAGNLIYVTSGNALATNVIAYNGNKIMGLSENLTINTTAYTTMQLRYLNATIGWALI